MNNQRSLDSFRSRFFPIYNQELLGFFLLSSCFFCVALQYATLRGYKDILVLGLKQGGPEAIAASKVFVLVCMVIFKVMYDTMCKYVSRYNRFNFVFGYFILFFSIALFLLYPNRDNWQIVTLTDKLNTLPIFKSFWPIWLMLRHWPLTLIYMHAECLGSFGLGVSLWGITNYISSVDQSKRIYPLLSLFAGLATFIAGEVVKRLDIQQGFMVCIVSFFVLILIYNWLISVVKRKSDVYIISKKTSKKKVKMSLKESFAVVFKSRYLTGIALLVLGYAISIVLFEGVYRDALKTLAAKDDQVIKSWTSFQLKSIGALQMICVWLAPYIMRRKWEFGASFVPRLLFVGTICFFGLTFLGTYIPVTYVQDNLQYLTVGTGLSVIVLVKTLKYILFDSTKEMAYSPLSDGQQPIAKSAVDGVGSRMGKGFSAILITFIIVPIFGDVANAYARGFIGILIGGTLVIWLWAVKDVGTRFRAMLKTKPKAHATKTQPVNKA